MLGCCLLHNFMLTGKIFEIKNSSKKKNENSKYFNKVKGFNCTDYLMLNPLFL